MGAGHHVDKSQVNMRIWKHENDLLDVMSRKTGVTKVGLVVYAMHKLIQDQSFDLDDCLRFQRSRRENPDGKQST